MRPLLTLAVVFLASCAEGPARPGVVALGQDACAQCRMVIVSTLTAAQIAAPGDDHRFFDDIGCLREHLQAGVALQDDAGVFVTDHRTGLWVDARGAVFTRTSLSTPMASGLLAHADTESRDADPAAAAGVPVPARDVLGSFARSLTP